MRRGILRGGEGRAGGASGGNYEFDRNCPGAVGVCKSTRYSVHRVAVRVATILIDPSCECPSLPIFFPSPHLPLYLLSPLLHVSLCSLPGPRRAFDLVVTRGAQRVRAAAPLHRCDIPKHAGKSVPATCPCGCLAAPQRRCVCEHLH